MLMNNIKNNKDHLKDKFENIKDYKTDIENVINYINNKTNILSDMYNNYLKEINDATNYRLSLDTFNFQTKLINLERENYQKILKIFLNRMYGDYYKLYKKLVDYVTENVKSVKIVVNKDYPKYKDLEILTEYKFELIDCVYTSTLSILNELSNYCIKENHAIKEIEKKQDNGININNFLSEKKYFIIILEQKINFYYDIIKGYIEFQVKFCKRFYIKLKLMYAQLSQDINLETSISKSDTFLLSNGSTGSNSSDSGNDSDSKINYYNDYENKLNLQLDKQLDLEEKTNIIIHNDYSDNEETISPKSDNNSTEKISEESEESEESELDSVELMKFY